MTKNKVQTCSDCNEIASTIPTAPLRDRDTAYPASKMSKIHPEQLQLQQPQKQTKSVQNNFNSSFRNQEYQQYRCDSEIDLEHQITVWN